MLFINLTEQHLLSLTQKKNEKFAFVQITTITTTLKVEQK